MAEEFTESPLGDDEILREEGTQKIILSGAESAIGVVVPAPRRAFATIRGVASIASTSFIDFLRWLGGSKVGLSVAAGLFAAFMTAIGFAVFDAGREQWMLEQKYPDAISTDERYVLYARDLMDSDRHSDAKVILQNLLARGNGDGLHADAQFLLGTGLMKTATDSLSASDARAALDTFAERFPTDPRVPVANRLVAESLARDELYEESTVRYKRLLRMLPEGKEKGEIELLIAKNLCEADNFTAARIALGELRQKYADTPIGRDSVILLGKMLIKYGRPDEAHDILQELVRQEPRTAHAGEALLMLAGAAVESGEYERAIGYCEEWFKYSPTSQDELEIMLLFARSELETGAPREAVRLVSEVFMSHPKSPRLAGAGVLIGQAYEALGDLEQAETYYLIATEMGPSNWEPHWRLSRLRSSEGKGSEAIKAMKHAVDLAPEEDFLLLELTKLYRLNGDEPAAFDILKTFTRERLLSPHIDEAYVMLADIYLQRGALQDAYRTLERLVAIGATTTDLPDIYNRQGDILYEADLQDDALEKYRMALEKGADRETQKLKIARTLLTSGKAQACLAELAEIEPAGQSVDKQFDFFDLRGQALLKLERYAEARAAIIKAIDLRSGREKFSTLASLMQANLELGYGDAASDIYELTLKLIETDDPGSPVPSEPRYIILGWARYLYNKKEYARAVEVYSRVGPARFPLADAAWALYQQGNCYFHMAEYDKAGEVYARLAVEFTDSEWVKFAEAKKQLIDVGTGI